MDRPRLQLARAASVASCAPARRGGRRNPVGRGRASQAAGHRPIHCCSGARVRVRLRRATHRRQRRARALACAMGFSPDEPRRAAETCGRRGAARPRGSVRSGTHGYRRSLLQRSPQVCGMPLAVWVPLARSRRCASRFDRLQNPTAVAAVPWLATLLSRTYHGRVGLPPKLERVRTRPEGEGRLCPKRPAVAATAFARPRARRAGALATARTSGHAPLSESRRRQEVVERLARVYAGAQTALHYENSFQLLIAVILSAQCTDARVNMVTPTLFKRFPTAESLARATPRQVEPFIKSCGFFRVKSRNIVNAAREIGRAS